VLDDDKASPVPPQPGVAPEGSDTGRNASQRDPGLRHRG
jgi:hypothetical protein